MSTVISNANRLIFGSDSPINMNEIPTEPNLKSTLLNTIMNKSSKIYRQRAFRVYRIGNTIFPDKVARVNDLLRSAIGNFINPFVTTNIQTVDELIFGTNRQKYTQGEIALTQILQKLTGVKCCLAMVVDSEKEYSATRHGIITYITKNTTLGASDEIEVTWNNGFFNFKDPQNTCIVIMFPKQYLASVIQHIIAATPKQLSGLSIDKITMKGNITDEITFDLIKSVFAAIFTDGIRSKFVSDIQLANSLLQKEGLNVSVSAKDKYDKNTSGDVFKNYSPILKKFKGGESDDHLVYELLSYYRSYSRNIMINPIEFYKGFVDTPYAHVEDIISKCSSFQRYRAQQSFDFLTFNYSNNFADMDIFSTDRDRDTIVFGIKLLRFLPWLLFNTYVLAGGAHHQNVKEILNRVDNARLGIMSYKASNYWMSPVIDFIINNMNYMTGTLYKELSSPLTVTDFSRTALVNGISKYGFFNSLEEKGEDKDEKSDALKISEKMNFFIDKETSKEEIGDDDKD